ncbi:hypothetical protein EU545_03440 [Candidatus Thorarchaeota archaeon]|nr:MAG: hypothetical protein EU545_03440 [Candidatus Thorarchaeota archaeon]
MKDRTPITLNRSRRVAITGVMAALTLVAYYALVVAPNVELGSSVLFVTGFLFGLEMALSCVLIVAGVFGLFNPWGPSIFILEIWLAQIAGWMLFALAGHITGIRRHERAGTTYRRQELALMGGMLTLFYDLVTNLGWSLASGIPYWVTLATGLPFLVVHVVSNILIFGIVVIPLDDSVRRALGGSLWESQESDESIAKNKKSVEHEQM